MALSPVAISQSERALRETAKMSSQEYPRVSKVVHKDIFLDDRMSGESTWSEVPSTTDALKASLEQRRIYIKRSDIFWKGSS